MNAGSQPILVVNQACGCTVTQVTEQFKSAGYAVVQSFDLLSAIDARHSKCICQMVVLLVYGKDGPPVTIILDGNDIIHIYFPGERTRTQLPSQIYHIIILYCSDS